jgi:hypothetical protein
VEIVVLEQAGASYSWASPGEVHAPSYSRFRRPQRLRKTIIQSSTLVPGPPSGALPISTHSNRHGGLGTFRQRPNSISSLSSETSARSLSITCWRPPSRLRSTVLKNRQRLSGDFVAPCWTWSKYWATMRRSSSPYCWQDRRGVAERYWKHPCFLRQSLDRARHQRW